MQINNNGGFVINMFFIYLLKYLRLNLSVNLNKLMKLYCD